MLVTPSLLILLFLWRYCALLPSATSSVCFTLFVVSQVCGCVFASCPQRTFCAFLSIPMHFTLQWNCRGLRANYQDLQTLIRWRTPLFIGLQETKLAPGITCSIKGYSVYRKDADSQTIAHGGVLLAVHHSLPARQLPLQSPLQAVAAKVHLHHREITVCSVYLPPGTALPVAELRRLIHELPAPVLIVGDFNAHNTAWGCDTTGTRGRLLESFIRDEALCILNTGQRTHLTLPSGRTSALDLSLVSPRLAQCFTWSVHDEPLGSDHFPVWLEYLGDPVLGSRPPRWNIRKADWGEFQASLETAILSRADSSTIPVEDFTILLLDSADGCIPRTSSQPRRNPVPWWKEECGDAIRARKRALRKFDRRSTMENLIAFKKARAFSRRVIKEAKTVSWRTYVSSLNRFTPTTQIWARMKRIEGRFSSVPLPVLRVNHTDILEPSEVAETIGRALFERCRGGPSNQRARLQPAAVDFSTAEQTVYNEPFTMEELVSAISSLRSVSEGPDSVHNDMLRHLPPVALEALLATFNSLWEMGTFPDTWREATVVPILKPGKSGEDPLHYRPISLTSSLSKLMEKMVNVRFSWFLEHHGVFTNAQCGFRKHRSPVDHILSLDTEVRACFTERKHLGAVFFDIEAAYDTVLRQSILAKVHKYGIRGRMGLFIRNFLSGRRFRVRVGSHLSSSFTQKNGVPQGGVLSVALFAVAINDIADELPDAIGRSLFVDDFAIWFSASNTRVISRQLQLAVTRLEKWSKDNGLRFSTAKTVAVHFCRRRCSDPTLGIRLYGQTIPTQPVAKFLGVQFDRRLTYKDHFKTLRERCFKSLNVLKCVSRTSYGADRKTLLLLYRSIVRSKLDYACFVYDGASESSKSSLDSVHHASLRVATGAFRTSPNSSLLVEAHEPPLSLRRQMLGMRYALKLRQFPSHPTYQYVFSESDTRSPEAVQRSGPFSARIRSLLSVANISLRGVRRVRRLERSLPPWGNVRPQVDLTLADGKKANFLPSQARARALEHIALFDGFTSVFTDGSKTTDGVGCAFVTGRDTRSFSLPANASVYSAELIAIEKALCFIEVCDDIFYLLLTDSLSSLLALRSFNPSDPLVQDVLARLTSLDLAGKSVQLCWIPSHVGIAGNELADGAARRAASAACTRRLPLPARDFIPAVGSFVQSEWQANWNAQTSKLKELKPQLGPWQSSLRSCRRQEVILCRLRIGHTYATHSHLLRGEEQPRCQSCDLPLTVAHVLIHCRHLEECRSRHLGRINPDMTLRHLLGDESSAVHSGSIFSFIQSINFPVIYTP